MNSRPFIPYNLPSIGEEEINEVVSTLKSGWITTGPRTSQFEEELREYVYAPLSLAVNSCTAGLHLALEALGLRPGDEVITTPLTFCATVNTILQAGAIPVLADTGSDGNIDPDSVEARITDRTRVILPVHLGGLPCEMDRLWDLARRYKLSIVEDAAHAIGSHYKGFPIGAGNPRSGLRSDAVVFSFYATKNLTTGEGGMITTHDATLLERMRILCLHGISKDAWNRYSENGNWYYEVVDCGYKYNLSDIQSAIGIHQLRKQESFIETRTRYAQLYNKLLGEVDEIELPPYRQDCRHSWHLYALRLKLDRLDLDRGEFIHLLRKRNIGASVHFIPIPLHPFYAGLAKEPRNHCPGTLELYPRLVSLPLYPAMAEEQIRYVADAVKDIIMAGKKTKVGSAAVSV
jgi:dTDP-4-amino-4,6-dideoxygalactose transaminase